LITQLSWSIAVVLWSVVAFSSSVAAFSSPAAAKQSIVEPEWVSVPVKRVSVAAEQARVAVEGSSIEAPQSSLFPLRQANSLGGSIGNSVSGHAPTLKAPDHGPFVPAHASINSSLGKFVGLVVMVAPAPVAAGPLAARAVPVKPRPDPHAAG